MAYAITFQKTTFNTIRFVYNTTQYIAGKRSNYVTACVAYAHSLADIGHAIEDWNARGSVPSEVGELTYVYELVTIDLPADWTISPSGKMRASANKRSGGIIDYARGTNNCGWFIIFNADIKMIDGFSTYEEALSAFVITLARYEKTL